MIASPIAFAHRLASKSSITKIPAQDVRRRDLVVHNDSGLERGQRLYPALAVRFGADLANHRSGNRKF